METVWMTPLSKTLAYASRYQQQDVCNKSLLRQSLPVLNCGCQLTGGLL